MLEFRFDSRIFRHISTGHLIFLSFVRSLFLMTKSIVHKFLSSAEWASSKIPSAKWSQARWYWIFIQGRRLFVTVFPETEQLYRQTFNFFFNRYYFSSNWWLLLFRFWSIFGPSRFWLSLIANHKICGFKYISWGFCRLEFLGYANNQFVKAGLI